MDDKFSLEKNHWQIQDPAWASASYKNILWHSYGIDNFWLQKKGWNEEREGILSVAYPSTAEHMYFILWHTKWDYIFASYSLAEIKRFLQLDIDVINKNYWEHSGMCTIFFIYDMVQKKWYAFKHNNLDVYYEVKYPLDAIKENANKIDVKQNES